MNRQLFLHIFFILCGALATPAQLYADSCCCDCTYDCTTTTKCQRRGCDQCHSVYIPRSTHSNSAYFWLAPAPADLDTDCWHHEGDVGIEYLRSFRSCDLARCLLGTNNLHFQGSQVPNRDSGALVADYFGLSHLFDGNLIVKPRIQNVNLHLQERLYLDRCHENLWVQLNVTFTHQKRNLFGSDCICDPISSSTQAGTIFPEGYMDFGIRAANSANTQVYTPAPTFSAPGIKDALSGDFLFGQMQTPWKFGRFLFDYQTLNKVAGVSLLLGYDFCRADDHHLGLFFQWTAPTGNVPNATYVFSPVVGNGKHNEIGAGIDAHWDICQTDEHRIALYLNGNVTTMLKNCQVRSFDFINRGCLSRYMLLKELTPTPPQAGTLANVQQSGNFGSFNYVGNLINGINFATRFVQVKVPVKGDATLRCIWHHERWDFGVGYNIYGQSSERLCIKPDAAPCSALDLTKHYGVKGCTGVAAYGYTYSTATNATNSTLQSLLVLNATSGATATNCDAVDFPLLQKDIGATNLAADWRTGINEPFNASNIPNPTSLSLVRIASSSAPAKEVTIADLDLLSGISPKQVIHKGFVTLTHTWKDCDYKPFVGLGAEVEGNSGRCNLKQWGFWLKVGTVF